MPDRTVFILGALIVCLAIGALSLLWPLALLSLVVVGPLLGLGLYDMTQTKDTILRNFPLFGHFRYLALEYRPLVRQYFVESDIEGRPLNKLERTVVTARARKELDTHPFGTQRDVYAVGYEWINHSIVPQEKSKEQPRVRIGGPACKKPYDASVLNISAMSYGSLSKSAIRALNMGAKMGGFYHNSGEGGVSPYHLEAGGDLCWQLGTAYFGARTPEGRFDGAIFQDKCARYPQIRMVELKLSQGAKPGKGGILPAAKVTPEIAEIRGVPMGKDALSPNGHREFSTPIELIEFIARLRELSGGLPVGFKLCVGKRREFFAICKAMVETGIRPDFITVDGGEGGTGAAPLEFSDSVGTPLIEGLIFVHNALVGYDLRKDIRIIASGGTLTGFGLAKRIAIGADLCNAARAFMFSLGCIQALKCNNNTCPTGVATQDPRLEVGLVPEVKAEQVHQFHKETIDTFNALLAAAGLRHPAELRPWHILRRTTQFEIHHYGEIFEYLKPGALLREPLPRTYARACAAAVAHSFGHASPDEEAHPVPAMSSPTYPSSG